MKIVKIHPNKFWSETMQTLTQESLTHPLCGKIHRPAEIILAVTEEVMYVSDIDAPKD